MTIGNIIGGALLVGAVYWFVFLRPHRLSPKPPPEGATGDKAEVPGEKKGRPAIRRE